MAYCHIFVLLFAAVTASPRIGQPADEVEEIKNVLQELLTHNENQQHVRNEHDHIVHHSNDHDGHDRTNIETLNLIFKHNKIVPNSISLPKPIARIGDQDDRSSLSLQNDLMCKLGVRCGCGNNAERCGCKGRSGGSCESHDNTLADTVIIKQNPYYIEAEGNIVSNNKKNPADPIIVNLLNDLEKSLLEQSTANDRRDEDDRIAESKKTEETNIEEVLQYVEKSLAESLDDGESIAHLRCCRNCERSSSLSRDDDKAYLRCCKKCGKNKKHYRNNIERVDDRDRRDRFNERDRRDKSDNRDHRNRLNDRDLNRGRGDRVDNRDRRNRLDNRDRRDRSDNRDRSDITSYKNIDKNDASPIDRARIFQINDDLDAIVLDVSDVGNVLKLLNNGYNFDNSNSIRDYVRAVNADKPPREQTYHNMNVPTIQQQMKISDIYRRSGRSGNRHGVPFELDVEGLGQMNP